MKRIDEYYDENKDASPLLVLKGIEMIILDEASILKDIKDIFSIMGDLSGMSPWDGKGDFIPGMDIWAERVFLLLQRKGGVSDFTTLIDQLQSRANAILALVRILRERLAEKNIK